MRNKMLMAMLLTFGMLAIVKAQPTTDNLIAYASGNVAVLLSHKAIQEELKMTEEEVNKVRDWTKDFRNKAIQIKKDKSIDLDGKFGVDREELEKLAAANAETRKVSYKELSDILKKAQIARLKQVDMQNMGVRAFTDDEVTSALKLTDKQNTSMKGFSEDMVKATRQLMASAGAGGKGGKGSGLKGGSGGVDGGGGGGEEIQQVLKKIQKVQKEYYDKAFALLTDEQKKKWKEMTGEPFDLEKLRFQFPKKKD